MVETVAGSRRRVDVRCDDPRLTSAAGLLLVGELDARLGMVEVLDECIGAVKQRRRGASGGELIMSWAEMMLAGGDFMCDLDALRADEAGAALRTVAEVPAPTTAAEVARRFGDDELAGVEQGVAEICERAIGRLSQTAYERVMGTRPTIDVDPTNVEVYAATRNTWATPTTARGRASRARRCGPRRACRWPPSCCRAMRTHVR